MLVLTRKTQQQIHIGDNITITIVRVKGQSVRVGIEAPKDVRVIRGELESGEDQPKRRPASLPAGAMLQVDSQPGASVPMPADPASPPCHRSGASMPQSIAVESDSKNCVEVRRRLPGASLAPRIRRSQRLGPASTGPLSSRIR